MKTITVIQARTTSSRLPGKALLDIAGYPSAVLAGLRAANQDQTTILATSDTTSDDELTRTAQGHGLAVFRGPLEDVLARYYLACSALPDDCAVVRLTADNVIPDGAFVKELAEAFAAGHHDYLSTDSLPTGLPYGLGAEVFSVAALRRAHREATSKSDREHVSPWIRQNCKSTIYRPRRTDQSDYSHLRATIDDEEDYQRIVCLFARVADPLHVRWEELLQNLLHLPGEAQFRVPYTVVGGRPQSKLTLGTAQLGMDYGVVNDSGQPSPELATKIVRTAVAHGVTTIDTARGYGSAEAVLGSALTGTWKSRCEVITKLNLSGLWPGASHQEVKAQVDGSVNASCAELRSSCLEVLLLHRWKDHHDWNGAAWERLLELQQQARIGTLGTSVYDPTEALEALQDPAIQHLQIPINVLDWRWQEAGIDLALADRPDVTVHARSALLQGILLHDSSRWPAVEGFNALAGSEMLRATARCFGRESVKDLCFAYVRSLPWVTSVVVGCETMQQLEENLRLFRTPDLAPQQCQELRRKLPRVPVNLLNPSRWKTLHETAAC